MKKRVLLTGAAGGMGYEALSQLLEAVRDEIYVIALDLPTDKNRKRLEKFSAGKNVEIVYGDLTDYETVKKAVDGCDIVVHIAAFVSPAADYFPKKAMEVNFGSTRNLIRAIYELGQENRTKYVSIGTVAETGDRMPPVHWGRVGDPIKPSMYDYYAVSKVAAERYVIESGLKYWVSLRQTGIMGPAMAKIRDDIQFHNCLDNVLEYTEEGQAAIYRDVINWGKEHGVIGLRYWAADYEDWGTMGMFKFENKHGIPKQSLLLDSMGNCP